MRLFVHLALVVIVMSGDSFFTRLALSSTDIDLTAFSLLRIVSACLIIALLSPEDKKALSPSLPLTLFLSGLFIVYTFAFSFAYTVLPISLGGLVLFGVTQVFTILLSVHYLGYRLNSTQWFGLAVVCLGGLSLLSPSITQEHAKTPLLMMAIAGLAWSGFTVTALRKGFSAFCFRKVFTYATVIISIPLIVHLTVATSNTSTDGYVYAILCGALSAGLGYLLWKLIAKAITSTSNGLAQLFVPLTTITLGIIFLSEPFSANILSASVLIIFGVGIFFFSEFLKKWGIEG
jgi:drug/metabolite transporter (DMT)-like permease